MKELATNKQKELMIKLGVPYKKNTTKRNAWLKIKSNLEQINNISVIEECARRLCDLQRHVREITPYYNSEGNRDDLFEEMADDINNELDNIIEWLNK